MRRKTVHGISAPCSADRDTNGFVNRRSTVQSRPLAQSSENSVTKEKDARCRARSPHSLCGTKTIGLVPTSGKPSGFLRLTAECGLTAAEALAVIGLCRDIRRENRPRCVALAQLQAGLGRLGLLSAAAVSS